jgi:hypothetical protein
MKPPVVFPESLHLSDLPEVHRLIQHIQHTAIDSENTPITSQEVAAVSNRVIHALVWQYPHLNQVIQESLDDLRFKASVGDR